MPKGVSKDLGMVDAGSAKIPLGVKKSILDMDWKPSDIEMFDGSKRLIGVPDSVDQRIFSDGFCALVFTFSHLLLPIAPIRLQSSATSFWDIPQSGWLKGKIALNGTGASL